MIIKTLLPIDEVPARKKWWVVDNVRRVSYYEASYNEVKELEFTFGTLGDNNSKDNPQILVICFLDAANNEQLYMLSGITYLLNDDGKTIERIW